MTAFHPRISVSLVSAGRMPLVESLGLVRELGTGAISLTTAQLGDDPARAIAAIRESGLAVASVGTGGASLIGSAAATLDALRGVIAAAGALACPTAFTVTGPVPSRMAGDAAFEQFVDTIGPARDFASGQGVRLAIENSSPATRQLGFISTLADACALADAANLGIVVELHNCWTEARLRPLFQRHVARFAIVNVSDFRVGEEPRFNRRVPGDGDIPLEWLMAALLDAGYSGYFDLEMLGPAIDREGSAIAIRRGVEWMAERLVRWGA